MEESNKKQTKVDLVRKEILKQAQEFGGKLWFSNTTNRNKILFAVDELTLSALYRYINILKDQGFLEDDNERGRGFLVVNPSL